MDAYIGNFKRKEVKYLVDTSEKGALIEGISDRMILDEYGASMVNSVYFDTPHRELIERSMDKPTYKEKLRLRWYGDLLNAETPAFLELKKKYKGIVYKRRIRLSYGAALAFMEGASFQEACLKYPLFEHSHPPYPSPRGASIEAQIMHEIEAFCSRHHPLVSSMSIQCVRYAYVLMQPSSPDRSLRITFDSSLTYRDMFRLSSPQPLLPFDQSVMEIKVANAYPLWLVQLLSETGVKPGSFSKYGQAYIKTDAERRKYA